MLRLRRGSASLRSGSALHDILGRGELAARLEAAPFQIALPRISYLPLLSGAGAAVTGAVAAGVARAGTVIASGRFNSSVN